MLLSIALPDKLPKSLIAFNFISKRPATGPSDDRLESPDHQSIFFTFNNYSMIKIKVQSNLSVALNTPVRVNQPCQTGTDVLGHACSVNPDFLYFDRRNN